MNQLIIKEIPGKPEFNNQEAAALLEQLVPAEPIDVLNWKNYPYRPDLKFRIAHIKSEIWLMFYVGEKYILANETKINGRVHKDSCVEFFVSFDKENYYNIECNCIGVLHVAHGKSRAARVFVDEDKIKQIVAESSLGKEPFAERAGGFNWHILLRIPCPVFMFDNITSFSGIKCTGNFYKCADDTTIPHFVTWNPVFTESPDYHRPEFFGNLVFE